jgi:hypothetical protein
LRLVFAFGVERFALSILRRFSSFAFSLAPLAFGLWRPNIKGSIQFDAKKMLAHSSRTTYIARKLTISVKFPFLIFIANIITTHGRTN